MPTFTYFSRPSMRIIADTFEMHKRNYQVGHFLILSDGFHRVSAGKQLGKEHITADIRNGSVQDALAYACVANLKHGKPMTRSEKQKAIKEYIKLNVKKSDRSIAKDVGCGNKTIGRYRKQLEAEGEIEPQERRIGDDGIEQNTGLTNVKPKDELQITKYDKWFSNHVIQGDTFIVCKIILEIMRHTNYPGGKQWKKLDTQE